MIIFQNFETPAPNKKHVCFLENRSNRSFELSNHVESIDLIESFRNLVSRPSAVDEGPSYDHFCEF